MHTDDNIIQLNPPDQDTAAYILARTFQNDPFYRFVFPDEKKRSRELQWLMDYPYGQCYVNECKNDSRSWI